MNSQQELLDAINTISQSKDRSCDTPATVLRVEGDTVWVHIDGGADETPVQKTINCEQGETVQVRISNGSAFLVGNASAPPTDDKTANVAHFVAEQADEKATEAIESVNAIVQTVSEKVDIGDSNIQDLSSTMYQNAYGVNIYNDTLAVGDSYAHIDGDSFDIKKCTTAGTIDDANDTMIASFGAEITVGSRASGTVGRYSQVYGIACKASGQYAHAEGHQSESSGTASHAEGGSRASGSYSHAEGTSNAVGSSSHSEGGMTAANGDYSHAEGQQTNANASGAHAEGYQSLASGAYSHAEGNGAIASGDNSHAQNYCTIASSDNQTVIGKYNVEDSNDTYTLIIGNGTAPNAHSDALRVDWSGNVLIDGDVQDLSGTRKYVAEPSSEGTNGQVLTTDGAGGRTWTTVQGGGGTQVQSDWNQSDNTQVDYIKNKPDLDLKQDANDKMTSADMADVLTPLPGARGNWHDFSTNEQRVGTWIDGKPIYEKTVDCGQLPNNTTKEVLHNISDLKNVIFISGFAWVSDSPTPIGSGWIPLPLVMSNNVSNNVMLIANATKIRIGTASNKSAYTKSYVTIQYTKTTD